MVACCNHYLSAGLVLESLSIGHPAQPRPSSRQAVEPDADEYSAIGPWAVASYAAPAARSPTAGVARHRWSASLFGIHAGSRLVRTRPAVLRCPSGRAGPR